MAPPQTLGSADAPAPLSSFKSLELDTWQRGAAAYDRLFGAVTCEAVAPLLDALAVGPGQQLLDICCGTGQALAVALQDVLRGLRHQSFAVLLVLRLELLGVF